MMNAVKKNTYALSLLVITSTAVMAESIEVRVIGTITPAACKLTLSGGGAIDYGTITAGSLKQDKLNLLENKQLDFAITCDAPAKVALRGINGRPNTAAGTTEIGLFSGIIPDGIPNANGNWVVGLGLNEGKRIGGYNIALKEVLVDGKAVDYIFQREGNKNWENQKAINFNWNQQVLHSWSQPGTLTPTAFTNLAGKLNVQAYINKVSELNLTKPIKLDGLTTVELLYL
ncbi:DUF1120 domain-containing protein [Providencia rettgeri]